MIKLAFYIKGKEVVRVFLLIGAFLIFSGCATKEDLYNKPAMFWYSKIIEEVKKYDLEEADKYYTSLASEHINSPILKDVMIIMALAHIDDEEYVLARFYLDEYIKRFGDKKGSEYARFLKVKASFFGLQQANRDQKLILDTLRDSKEFKDKYPYSQYSYMVDTIISKLEIARYVLIKDIASLHKKLENEKAYEIYKAKMQKSWVNKMDIEEPKNNNFVRKIFE